MNVLIALIATVIALPVGAALGITLFKAVILISYNLGGI